MLKFSKPNTFRRRSSVISLNIGISLIRFYRYYEKSLEFCRIAEKADKYTIYIRVSYLYNLAPLDTTR